MLKQVEVTVDGTTYLITNFPATKGVNIMKRLVRLIGAPLAALRGEGDEVFSRSPMEVAIEKLTDNFDKVEVEALVVDLLSGVTKGGMSLNFDMEFSGRYDVLFRLVQEAIKSNFGSVFQLAESSGTALDSLLPQKS